MASNTPNLECRMYEAKYPEVDTAVMIQVKSIDDVGAYVSLLEYNNMEGMILLSELSSRRIRSINSLIKVGRIEPVMVFRVEEDKGYIDLSKRKLSKEDIKACEERYNKSKLVHSIMRHVAETLNVDLEELYVNFAWPLYKKYGHATEAFKTIATDPDSVLNSLSAAVSEEVKECLVKNIRRRMPQQLLKIRADVEIKCFQFDGVLHIKDALRKADAAPRYVVTTQSVDKKQGMSVLNKAIAACGEAIEHHKGNLVVKEAPIVLNEVVEEKVIGKEQKKEDWDEEEEEDTGLGDVDVENACQGIMNVD